MVGQGLRLKIGITDLRVGISHDPGVILVGNKWPYYNRNDGIYRSVYHGFLCVFVVTDAMRVLENVPFCTKCTVTIVIVSSGF